MVVPVYNIIMIVISSSTSNIVMIVISSSTSNIVMIVIVVVLVIY